MQIPRGKSTRDSAQLLIRGVCSSQWRPWQMSTLCDSTGATNSFWRCQVQRNLTAHPVLSNNHQPKLLPEKYIFFFPLPPWDLKNTGLGEGFLFWFGFLVRFFFLSLLCASVEWSAESQESFPTQLCASVKLTALKSCSYKTSAYLGAFPSSVWHPGLWRAAQDNKKALLHLHDLTPPQCWGAAPALPRPTHRRIGVPDGRPIPSQSGAGREGRANKLDLLSLLASLISFSQNLTVWTQRSFWV